MERNVKNYASYHINCCTIYNNFGRVTGKQIRQYFFNLIIMWVVKPVESFVGDLGMEVFSQKFIQLRVFFGIFNDISNHVYFHFLDSVNWQQNIDFSTMHHKSCGHKIYDKGFHLLLFLIHQNNSPLC